MTELITAIVENGLLRPDTPLNLPDKTQVQVVVQAVDQANTSATSQQISKLLYDEIINFIAFGTTPQSVLDFRPSKTVKERVTDLIEREKTMGLSANEVTELDHYLQLEHIMRLAKARARSYLDQTPAT